jgi:agmatinase
MANDTIKDTTLVRSGFIRTKQEREDQYKVTHLVTGKQFKVGQSTIDVLDYFQEPRSLQDVEVSPKMLSSLEFLLHKGLLVDQTHAQRDVFRTTTAHANLFGFEEYDELSTTQHIVLVGIPFGGGNASSPETRRFPSVLRQFAEGYNLRFGENKGVNYRFMGNGAAQPIHFGKHLEQKSIQDGGDIFVHYYESRADVYHKISLIFDGIFAKGHIPFAFGGDHSITFPIVRSAAAHIPSFSVLHFDAHTDVYSSTFESILADKGLHHHGNFVSHCLRLEAVNHYYQFGIRGVNNAFHKDESPKLKIAWIDEVRQFLRGEIELALPDDEYYYLTFDIDVLDPSIAPGTATPVPNGLTFDEVVALFQKLKLHEKKIIGVDIVEVNPKNDINSITISIATQIIANLLNIVSVV